MTHSSPVRRQSRPRESSASLTVAKTPSRIFSTESPNPRSRHLRQFSPLSSHASWFSSDRSAACYTSPLWELTISAVLLGCLRAHRLSAPLLALFGLLSREAGVLALSGLPLLLIPCLPRRAPGLLAFLRNGLLHLRLARRLWDGEGDIVPVPAAYLGGCICSNELGKLLPPLMIPDSP